MKKRKKVVAVIDYRSSREIRNIMFLLAKAGKEGKVEPEHWKKASRDYRAFIVYDDGSCRLHTLSTATLVKRLKMNPAVKEKE